MHNFMSKMCSSHPMNFPQGSHRLENYLNLEGFLEKTLKLNLP